MSGGHAQLMLKPTDAYKLLVCNTHLGSGHVNNQAQQYVFKRRQDGTHLINIAKTWEKLMFAARAIAAIENPADVCVVSARPFAQRALLKFAAHTGATAIVGRFVPGSFTNQIQKRNFKEPRIIIVSDPRIDHQAIHEASYVNVPVIAFTNSDSPLKQVDIAIPGNNKGVESVGLMWWFLTREILRLRGKITIKEDESFFMLDGQKIMPDLYFYRDPEEEKKREELEEQTKHEQMETTIVAPQEEWGVGGMEMEPESPITFQPVIIDDWAAASQNLGQPMMSVHTAIPETQRLQHVVQPFNPLPPTSQPVDDDEW